ncbi:hypothetical protein [Paraburkholderia strydomiana]|uniref:hypothetical protein n=1 Tax=Paraburkholderia strydomiana TaxID=1245417 RepID=UPI002858E090|nr:hypothetical protein [Paraburkholderia strydomiana]MDR7010029.1 hypothetical protein [Paraburkholderia strydomiana]
MRTGWSTASIGDISLDQAGLVERIDFRFAEPPISEFAIRFRSEARSGLRVFAPTVRLMPEMPEMPDTNSIDGSIELRNFMLLSPVTSTAPTIPDRLMLFTLRISF